MSDKRFPPRMDEALALEFSVKNAGAMAVTKYPGRALAGYRVVADDGYCSILVHGPESCGWTFDVTGMDLLQIIHRATLHESEEHDAEPGRLHPENP